MNKIAQATKRFYQKQARSFSDTRTNAWRGWARLLAHIESLRPPLSVLDIGCGNLRFERFLSEHEVAVENVFALDQCSALLQSSTSEPDRITRIEADILDLLESEDALARFDIPLCSLTVCFALMHHIPTPLLRQELMHLLLSSTKRCGIIAVSFWQFSNDERIARKASVATKRAAHALDIQLTDARDAFLGWQDDESVFRFCHDFSNEEIDELKDFAEGHGARIVDDYHADGKRGDLNRYLVMEKVS